MTEDYSRVVSIARDYYNSDDADNFYFHIWGGEDIHIGLYQSEDEPIFDASLRTVETMAAMVPSLGPGARVLDIGAGYGGAARRLASAHGCSVVALNLSEVENERDREMNREQGLDHLIDVVDGSFESLPFDAASFEVVWSQDAILHSGERARVIAEVARVLKPGGHFVFTDIMQVEGVSKETLQPVLDRIHLDSLGTVAFYEQEAGRRGMKRIAFAEHSHQLPAHYGRVLRETEAREAELLEFVSREYLERMKKGLRHWVEAGHAGRLEWGILHFQKSG